MLVADEDGEMLMLGRRCWALKVHTWHQTDKAPSGRGHERTEKRVGLLEGGTVPA